MRLLPALLALSIVCLPAVAQPPAAADARAEVPEARARMTWQQRFAKANASGDGQLTLEQAQAGYPTIARNFSDIDLDAKGYVTQDDIKAWHKARRDARQQAKRWSEDPLRPRAAFQRVYPDPPAPSTTMIGTDPRPKEGPKPAPDLSAMEAPADDPS